MRTNVYVDGFNLYYGCLKGSAYRWLDLEVLCARRTEEKGSDVNLATYLLADAFRFSFRGSLTHRWFETPSDHDQSTLASMEDAARPTQADRTRALALLRMADLGIDDVVFDEQEVTYAAG